MNIVPYQPVPRITESLVQNPYMFPPLKETFGWTYYTVKNRESKMKIKIDVGQVASHAIIGSIMSKAVSEGLSLVDLNEWADQPIIVEVGISTIPTNSMLAALFNDIATIKENFPNVEFVGASENEFIF